MYILCLICIRSWLIGRPAFQSIQQYYKLNFVFMKIRAALFSLSRHFLPRLCLHIKTAMDMVIFRISLCVYSHRLSLVCVTRAVVQDHNYIPVCTAFISDAKVNIFSGIWKHNLIILL